MILDSGIVRIYRPPADEGGVGRPDHEDLTLTYESWYGDLTVGVTRHWLARQANTRLDREIRIIAPEDFDDIRMDDIAIIDGARYRILQCQHKRDEDAGEDVCDLSLTRIGDKYDRYSHII